MQGRLRGVGMGSLPTSAAVLRSHSNNNLNPKENQKAQLPFTLRACLWVPFVIPYITLLHRACQILLYYQGVAQVG